MKDEERERPDGPPFLILATGVNKKSGVSVKDEGGGAVRTARLKKPSSRNGAAAKPGSGTAKKPVRVRNFKGHAKKQLSESFSEIIEAHLGQAKKGSLKHTDWLFEIGGVKQEVKAEKKVKGSDSSLALLLLEELKKQQGGEKKDGEEICSAGNVEEADPSLRSG